MTLHTQEQQTRRTDQRFVEVRRLTARRPKPGGIPFYLPLANAISSCRKPPVLLRGGSSNFGSGNHVLHLWRFTSYVIILSEWCDSEMCFGELPLYCVRWTRYFDRWLCSYLHVVCFFPVVLLSYGGYDLLMFNVSRSHTSTHHSRQDSPLDEWSARCRDPNLTTQHSQEIYKCPLAGCCHYSEKYSIIWRLKCRWLRQT